MDERMKISGYYAVDTGALHSMEICLDGAGEGQYAVLLAAMRELLTGRAPGGAKEANPEPPGERTQHIGQWRHPDRQLDRTRIMHVRERPDGTLIFDALNDGYFGKFQ